MISADLHLHTCYSHGCDTPAAMYASAREKGLALIGFSEHSPRPDGYNYSHEYREHLQKHFQDYANGVQSLKQESGGLLTDGPKVLFGLEMDWLDGEEDFIAKSIAAHDFDYLVGSVHFLDHWGFDDGSAPWENASQEECESWYIQYFKAWKKMILSGFFQIAAHPDLIKIYSLESFHIWLEKPESRKQVEECLEALKKSGMAMEISSAGLRKACAEIYPCPTIMEMAARLEIPVSFASDAHCSGDVAAFFPELAGYARAFGFTAQSIFNHGRITALPL